MTFYYLVIEKFYIGTLQEILNEKPIYQPHHTIYINLLSSYVVINQAKDYFYSCTIYFVVTFIYIISWCIFLEKEYKSFDGINVEGLITL